MMPNFTRPISKCAPLELLSRRPAPAPPFNLASTITLVESQHGIAPSSQQGSWLQAGVKDLTRDLRPRFHNRIQVNEPEHSSLSYLQYVRGGYIEPVLAAANQHRLDCLPPLIAKEKASNIMNAFRLEIGCGDLPFPEHVPTDQIRGPLPAFVFLPPSTLDLLPWTSPSLIQNRSESNALLIEAYSIIQQEPERDVCITDTRSALVFRGAHAGNRVPEKLLHETVSDLDKLPLRLVIASLIWSTIERTNMVPAYRPQYFCPHYSWGSTQLSGALNDPSQPRATWKQAMTWSSRSDFDYFTVVNDPLTGELLDRWMTEIPKLYATNPLLQPGDLLDASATSLADVFPPFEPVYGVQPLPLETDEHLDHRKRPPIPAIKEIFESCRTFTMKITETFPVYDRCDGHSYACRLISTDGQVVQNSPELRLKLYDDRQTKFSPMNEYEDSASAWFDMEVLPTTATELVRHEDAIFRRLSHAQGSFLPYYYGAHQICLRDGTTCWGIVTELVRGTPLRKISNQLSEDAKINIIRSMRHLIRVLQYAEVKRSWWKYGDITISDDPDSETSTCIVMNMSHARFSTLGDLVMPADDYREVQHLLYRTLSNKLVDEHFSPMEEWDYYLDDRNAYVGEGWLPGDSDDYPST